MARGTRFIADVMLKKTARWMRILGIPVEYPESEDDDEIMGLAQKEKSTLLTMDEELYRRCFKRGVKCFLVPQGTGEEQVGAICKKFGIDIASTFPSKTLCPKCNGKLERVGREMVTGKVLENVRKRHEEFWLCDTCGQVFWEGSHWKKIEKSAGRIKRIASERVKRKKGE